jgi:hypothetical protein
MRIEDQGRSGNFESRIGACITRPESVGAIRCFETRARNVQAASGCTPYARARSLIPARSAAHSLAASAP